MARDSAEPPSITSMPPVRHVALIGVGMLAVGTSGPLIAATAVSAIAIAFWRNALGTVATIPLLLVRPRSRTELMTLGRREWRFALVAGFLLALHFVTWVPSLDYTSVASSVALVATQPIWAALLARLTGHTVPVRVWIGITVALIGVLLLTGVDFAVSTEAVLGDVLAVVGGIFAAAYVSAGAVVRRSVSTVTYTTVCYGTCALLLLAGSLIAGVELGGYEADDWAKLAALTIGPQILGHSIFNHVLTTTSATLVSLAILAEVPIAAALAALWLGQTPPLAALPAAALLLLGIAIVIGWRTAGQEPSMPAE